VSFDSETEDDKHMPSRIKLIRGRIKVSYSDVDKVLRECNDKSIDEAVEQTVNDALAKMKSGEESAVVRSCTVRYSLPHKWHNEC